MVETPKPTRAAGCFVQIIGATLILGGLSLENPTGYFLALIGLALLIWSGITIRKGRKARKKKKCPFCAEEILADAKICKHCGKELPI